MLGTRGLTLVLMVAALIRLPPCGAQAPAPPWRGRLMPWQTHAGQPRPWREDPRLAGRAAPDYPDDFQVAFLNPDSARGGRHEAMWVRAIAYHPASDLFLGILLNQPDFLRSVQEGDNVVFRIDPSGYPVAVGAPDYGVAGWPAGTTDAFSAALRAGLRAYRAGNDGHNMPAIDRCIAVLAPAIQRVPPAATRDARFVGHYVLGRCLAERYTTEQAAGQFRAALALDPDDVDAHMALLAELSVMTHRRPGTLPPAEEARWERAFLEELAVVRRRFATADGVAQVLAFVFDPSQEAQVDTVWRPHLAKLRRVGYGVFRWKQR